MIPDKSIILGLPVKVILEIKALSFGARSPSPSKLGFLFFSSYFSSFLFFFLVKYLVSLNYLVSVADTKNTFFLISFLLTGSGEGSLTLVWGNSLRVLTDCFLDLELDLFLIFLIGCSLKIVKAPGGSYISLSISKLLMSNLILLFLVLKSVFCVYFSTSYYYYSSSLFLFFFPALFFSFYKTSSNVSTSKLNILFRILSTSLKCPNSTILSA